MTAEAVAAVDSAMIAVAVLQLDAKSVNLSIDQASAKVRDKVKANAAPAQALVLPEAEIVAMTDAAVGVVIEIAVQIHVMIVALVHNRMKALAQFQGSAFTLNLKPKRLKPWPQ
jgi:hypothetical protein